MAAGREDAPGADLYAVLGLNRECTHAELRVAYRKLAMIWHPDRCSATGSSARVEEAKERFQEIQGAYAVLSDSNKRFLYDVGVYDCDDDEDDLSGMGDFLGEMADMMSQATPTESFEELQQLFVDMFQEDIVAGICGAPRPAQQRAAESRRASRPQQPTSQPPPARTNHRRAPPACTRKPSSRPGRAGLSPGLFCFKVSETKQRPAPRVYDVTGGEGRSGWKQRPSTSRVDVSDGFSRSRQSRASSWQ